MNQNVTTTTMDIDGREFVLAEVSRGMGQIGIFRCSSTLDTATDVFYIEKEPILKINNPNTGDKNINKYITQISGWDSLKNEEVLMARLSASSENYYEYSQGLARSAVPVLELLNPGLYVVHDSQMHASDGESSFFWNNYAVKRDVVGTADRNAIIGESNYSPSFILPTRCASHFQPKKMASLIKRDKKLCGVAYHISGMFSALLEGHHAATAALLNDSVFRCLLIEPLTDVIYDSPKTNKNRKIVALGCPYVKIPLEEFPENTLERFLVGRRHIKPSFFSEIRPKMGKTLRAVGKRAFSSDIYERAEQLPTCGLIEAASAVSYLSEVQLEALLEGKVKYVVDEETGVEEFVVSKNYYSSVVAAANYLQVNDLNRFFTFCMDLLKNSERKTVHKYIAERLLTIMHPTVAEFFKEIAGEYSADGGTVREGGVVIETAHKYLSKWNAFSRRKQDAADKLAKARKKKVDAMQAITETKGIATLEMAVKDIDIGGTSRY
jgi:hypothetical protein